MFAIEQYLKRLKKELKVESDIKKKILEDIRSDIDMHIKNGKTEEEVIQMLGDPRELARDFNQHYPDYIPSKYKRIMKCAGIVMGLAAIVCLIIGLIGRNTFLNSEFVSNIGGVDKPSKVIVSSEPLSSLALFDGLINIAVILFVAVILCVGYLFFKSRKKGGK